MNKPLVQLRRYQAKVFRHPSGVLALIYRRQSGKSYLLAVLSFDRMMEKPGVSVMFMSASLRLGGENILKMAQVWRDIMDTMKAEMAAAGLNLTSSIDGLKIDDAAEIFEKQRFEARIWFDRTNYSRALAIAPNPDTAVGFTGWLIFDEVGRIPDFQACYEAAEPFVSSNPEFQIRMATTPPPDDKHYSYELLAPGVADVFPVCPDGNFYTSAAGILCHRADAFDVHEAGFPLYHPKTRAVLTPQESRALAWDKTAWDRNYGCLFLKGGTAALAEADLRHAMEAGKDQGLAINVTETLEVAA